MNNKAQIGFLKILFFVLVFIIFFAFALAPMINTNLKALDLSVWGEYAWIVGGLNIWILGAFVILVFMALAYGFSNE
jgi:TRAP-type mannitol/chloroaromatic compound transport system permease small subunit